jgi:hypothetical protein
VEKATQSKEEKEQRESDQAIDISCFSIFCFFTIGTAAKRLELTLWEVLLMRLFLDPQLVKVNRNSLYLYFFLSCFSASYVDPPRDKALSGSLGEALLKE